MLILLGKNIQTDSSENGGTTRFPNTLWLLLLCACIRHPFTGVFLRYFSLHLAILPMPHPDITLKLANGVFLFQDNHRTLLQRALLKHPEYQSKSLMMLWRLLDVKGKQLPPKVKCYYWQKKAPSWMMKAPTSCYFGWAYPQTINHCIQGKGWYPWHQTRTWNFTFLSLRFLSIPNNLKIHINHTT